MSYCVSNVHENHPVQLMNAVLTSICHCRVAERRKVAMASIDLMIERYSRIRQEEESKNGLIILAAVYGKMIDGMLDLIIRSSDFYLIDISAFVY